MIRKSKSRFYDNRFDEGTRLKLEIFRGYIREWIPVFLSSSSRYRYVNIYDFFAGPGYDAEDNPGSPLIILDELTTFLDEVDGRIATTEIQVFLNEANAANIKSLRKNINDLPLNPRIKVETANLKFSDAFQKEIPHMQSRNSANLVILDQFGYKFIDEKVFLDLIECATTDILFFLSSTNIKRFADEESTQRYIPVQKEELVKIPHNEIHRFICNQVYRAWVPEGLEYYLAPFSIRKDEGNIYGLIFGSGHLLGLEKFLRVCWNEDKVTGEANFNIDCDAYREGILSLFSENNIIKKQDKFRQDVLGFLVQPRDNRELYQFCLENGFLPKHINEALRQLETERKLTKRAIDAGVSVRKGIFYIGWENYKTGVPKIKIIYGGDQRCERLR